MRLNIILLILTFLNPASTIAELKNPELDKYLKCFKLFTRDIPESNDTLLNKITSHEITGNQACQELLSLVKPNSNNKILVKNDSIPQKILETFNSFHRSWFSIQNFTRYGIDGAIQDIIDINEAAYHITYSQFSNEPASKIFTRSFTFKGIREGKENLYFQNSPFTKNQILKKDIQWFFNYHSPVNKVFWQPDYLILGPLIGIEPNKSKNPINFNLIGLENENFNVTADQFNGFHAGIIGSNSYLLLNTNMDGNVGHDTFKSSHRRFAKNIFSDFFCRTLPVVTLKDAEPFVNKNSFRPYEKTAECMMCHTTMDPISNSVRNLIEIWATPEGLDGIFQHRMMAEVKTELPSIDDKNKTDTAFSKRPPNGALFYRTLDGTLIKEKTYGIKGLSSALSKQKDIYTCFASRYLKFLTGIDTSSYFNAENRFSSNKKEEILFLNKISNNFYAHKNINKLILDIINSKYFIENTDGHNR